MSVTPGAILTSSAPELARSSQPVVWPDPTLPALLQRLHATLADFRSRNGFGRAISAPQIGANVRVIAVQLGATPFALINPELTWRSDDTFEVWDDCLSVPDKIVRVKRHSSVSLRFLDEQGRTRAWRNLPRDMSELIQHEMDHLDGILMTERAIDAQSIRPLSDHAELIANTRPARRLSLDAIVEASQVIDPVFLNSPQFNCEALSDVLGCQVTLKIETGNPIRSFKGRGADYFVTRTLRAGDDRQMVCASAGNFGQALAYACRKHARALVVYASVNANPLKIERMRSLGADVRLAGDDFDAAKAAAVAYGESIGALIVEDGLQVEITEGAGTLGLELLLRGDAFDAILVSLGGGALQNGIARWVKAASPATRMLGVSSTGADAMEKSWRSGRTVVRDRVSTIADGIAVRIPIPEAVADMVGTVDDVLLVSDDDILAAMRLLYEQAGVLCEPAGAAGLAAILANRARFEGRQIATIICGNNMTPEQIQKWYPHHA